jgi:hypothetical protein
MDRDQINAKNERNLYDYSRPDAMPVLEGLLLDGTLPVQAPRVKKPALSHPCRPMVLDRIPLRKHQDR